MSPGVENKISAKKYILEGSISVMAYTISKKHPKYFFLASYQMSPGEENKISTKKYFRGGQKSRKLSFFL